jgi:hypothetical protein
MTQNLFTNTDKHSQITDRFPSEIFFEGDWGGRLSTQDSAAETCEHWHVGNAPFDRQPGDAGSVFLGQAEGLDPLGDQERQMGDLLAA